MFQITDTPTPAVATLRSPQAALNARRILRDRVLTCAQIGAWIAFWLAIAAVVAIIAHVTYTTLAFGVPATLEQAVAMGAM